MLCVSAKKNSVYIQEDVIDVQKDGSKIDSTGNSGVYHVRRQSVQEDHRGTAFVELPKREGCGLGLVISGGADKDCTPRVSYLRPGGIAQRSDALEVGDYIVSVNGIKTAYLRHDEIVSLIKNAEESVILEVDYELPEPPQTTFSVICKRIEVLLRRDSETFGFTLRGGLNDDPGKCRPLTVTQIRPGSAADREGTLKVGDRILSIDGVNVMRSSLAETLSILKHSEESTRLLVEYDVSVIDAVQNSQGPLLVEIDKTPGCSLGIDLAATTFKGQTVLCISRIEPASIADRCGALHKGDHILAIDDTSLEHMTVAEASQLLKSSMGELIRLEILPAVQLKDKLDVSDNPLTKCANSKDRKAKLNPCDGGGDLGSKSASMASLNSLQSFTTFNSMTTQVGSAIAPPCSSTVGSMSSVHLSAAVSRTGTLRSTGLATSGPAGWANRSKRNNSDTCLYQPGSGPEPSPAELDRLLDQADCPAYMQLWAPHASDASGNLQQQLCPFERQASLASASTYVSTVIPHHQVCRTETIEVTLVSDHRGFGLILENGSCDTEALLDPPIITFIEPCSAAERCGVIQEGDRIMAINDVSLENRTLAEANRMLNESGVKVLLLVEFDVAESIVPNSGIFVVKLAKRGSGLGITINSPTNRKPGEPLLITDVRKGSVAHRTGTIQPGDRLLAIGNVRMDNCSLEDAAQVLQNSEDIVKLKIRKDETFADEPDPTTTITYTVELPKFGGPLGITISGTEEPFDPIYISSLADGGLAEKTGALHVGDRILAINGQSLRGRPLPDAIQLLQNARDTVTLKITRPAHQSSGSSGIHSQDNPINAIKGGGSTYCDLSNELHLEEEEGVERFEVQSPSISAPPSCTSDTDEWSRRLDELDHFSQAEVVHDADLDSVSPHSPNLLSSNISVRLPSATSSSNPLPHLNLSNKLNSSLQSSSHSSSSHSKLSSLQHDQHSLTSGSGSLTHPDNPHPPTASQSSASSQVMTADMHLREVEEQLQNIFTPTPVELLRVTLERQRESESFGFSLSDGVYEKGVYISAIQPNGPAECQGRIRSFDRLLQVNHVRTKDLDCHQVVPLIARSGLKVHLVLSRNPLANTPVNTPTSSPRSTIQRRDRKDVDLSSGRHPPPRPIRTSSQKSLPEPRRRQNDTSEDDDGLVWKPQYGLHNS